MPTLAQARLPARWAWCLGRAAMLAFMLACDRAIALDDAAASAAVHDLPGNRAPGAAMAGGPHAAPSLARQQRGPPPPAAAWHPHLLRDRRHELLLQEAAAALGEGRTAIGLRQLQSILDDEFDAFARSASPGRGDAAPAQGAAFLAERRIGQLSDPDRALYERLHGPAARRLLQQALHDDSETLLTAMLRRYFHTAAGFDAGCRLAARAADHADFARALALWNRLHADRLHRQRFLPVHRAQKALCLAGLGQPARAAALLGPRLHEEAVEIGGDRLPAADLLARFRAFAADAAPIAARNPGDDPQPAADQVERIPLPPVWSRPLAGDQTGHIARLALAWEPHQVRNGLPLGTMQTAIVAEGCVLFRDYEALRAVELASGRPLWSFPCQSTLAAAIPERRAPAPDKERDPDPNGVMRLVVGNCTLAGGAALGGMACDGQRLYVVDRFVLQESGHASVERPPDAQLDPRAGATLPAQSNLLLALPLTAAAKPPEAVWRLGGTLHEAPATAAPLAGHYFIGPPLVAGDRLYAASEFNLQVFVSCICARTGAVQWCQAICTTPQPISTDAQRFAVACTPALGDGLVVCPTHVGLVVALDAVTGRLRWGMPVEDTEQSGRGHLSPLPYQSRARVGHPGFPNHTIITKGRLLILPPHSDRLWCLDLATGQTLWRTGREDLERATAIEFLAGEAQGIVLLVGRRKLRGLSLVDGALKYLVRLPAMPAGGGARQGDEFHLFLDDGRWLAVAIASGECRQLLQRVEPRLAGNLSAAGPALISISRTEIACFRQPLGTTARTARPGEEVWHDSGGSLATAAGPQPTPGMVTPRGDPGRTISRRLLADLSAAPWPARRHDAGVVLAGLTVPAGGHPGRSILLRRPPRAPSLEQDGLDWARQLADENQGQQAETMLLSLRESGSPGAMARAGLQLADLWTRHGLHHQAALALRGVPPQERMVAADLDQPGNLALRDPQTLSRLERLRPADWDLSSVRIEESRMPDSQLQAVYNVNGVHCLVTPRHCPFDLFDAGATSEALFTLVDRATGQVLPRRVGVSGRYFYPVASQAGQTAHSFVGNLVPLGGAGVVRGLSLLEQRLVWTTSLPGLEESRDLVRVGAANPALCVCQHRQHLYALDPLDGHVLWHRDDLEPTSGLMSTSSDPSQGIIGDDRVIVVFASNGADYTLYDARDGAETGRGRLDVQPRQPRRALGRLLLHFSDGPDGKFLRVWDPLAGRYLLDQPSEEIAESSTLEGVPPGTKLFALVRDRDAALLLTRGGRLQGVDCRTGGLLCDLPLEAHEVARASFLRAFQDHERMYCNVQQAWPPGKGPPAPGYIVSDAVLPLVHCLGELHALDPLSGRILWRRNLGHRSIVHAGDFAWPILVTLCRVRKGDQTFLEVEVLDARTGATLAQRDNLLADRLLQLRYEREPGQIELRGAKSSIRIAIAGATRRDP